MVCGIFLDRIIETKLRYSNYRVKIDLPVLTADTSNQIRGGCQTYHRLLKGMIFCFLMDISEKYRGENVACFTLS
jgi:hypothetical protein